MCWSLSQTVYGIEGGGLCNGGAGPAWLHGAQRQFDHQNPRRKYVQTFIHTLSYTANIDLRYILVFSVLKILQFYLFVPQIQNNYFHTLFHSFGHYLHNKIANIFYNICYVISPVYDYDFFKCMLSFLFI